MKVSAEAKRRTRERILHNARTLFQKDGFEQTTTRDIARAAQIATGTLFNYFPTKEALAMTLVSSAVEGARAEFRHRIRPSAALGEKLFDHVAVSLRHLRPHRAYIRGILEPALSPVSPSAAESEGDLFRRRHLETVEDLIGSAAGAAAAPNLLTLHLYWTLFLGVLSYWSSDDSERQEETLVLLDQSMRLFASSICEQAVQEGGTDHGSSYS